MFNIIILLFIRVVINVYKYIILLKYSMDNIYYYYYIIYTDIYEYKYKIKVVN